MAFTPEQLAEAFMTKTFELPNGSNTTVRACLADIRKFVWNASQIRDEDKTRDQQISALVDQLSAAIDQLNLSPSEIANITSATVASTLDSGEVEVRVDVAAPEEE